MQNFGNDFVLFVYYIFYKCSVPMVFVGCLDAGDPTRCSAASCGMNRRSESIVRCVHYTNYHHYYYSSNFKCLV